MKAVILIIDDEVKITKILKRVLEREGHEVDMAHEAQQGVELMRGGSYDIILSDLKMPGMSGVEVLKNARTLQPNADFIMMTAYASVETAIESMKLGAFDYLIKPFPVDALKKMISQLMESRKIGEEEPRTPAAPIKGGFEKFIGESAAVKAILDRARKVAPSDVSVLLLGESGTGKEVLARAIYAAGNRAHMPLITVNCGAIPENLLESELFGHARGAFTGAVESRKGLFKAADGGTIFLDEVGEMPVPLQVKLLRVLQDGEFLPVGITTPEHVDVRIIAATNKDLEKAVEDGSFRKDLFYRLNVIPIQIPPLKERREDISLLIYHFMKKFNTAGRKFNIAPDSMKILRNYDWPGNVRELENAIEHAAILCDEDIVKIENLPDSLRKSAGELDGFDISGALEANHLTLEEMERRLIQSALEKSMGNQTKAAELLGITRRTLGYRIKKYDLDSDAR